MHLISWRKMFAIILISFCARCALRPGAESVHQRPRHRRFQAAMQNARVVIDPGDTVPTSDSLGDFVVTGLAPGSYTVTVTSVGFKQLVQTVTVAAGQTAPLNLVLQVASGNEQVVVSAESGQDMVQAVNEEITSPNIVQVMPRNRDPRSAQRQCCRCHWPPAGRDRAARRG